MLAEGKQVKRYLGARFGYGETIPQETFAVPTTTSRGNAFMKFNPAGKDNFMLFWDEDLTVSWYDNKTPPKGLKETEFSKQFRKLESVL